LLYSDAAKAPGIILLKKTLLFHQDLSREFQEIKALSKLCASTQFLGMGAKMNVVCPLFRHLGPDRAFTATDREGQLQREERMEI